MKHDTSFNSNLRSLLQMPFQTQLSGIITTLRPATSAISSLLIFLWMTAHSDVPIWLAAAKSIPISLLSMAGFVANDLWDANKDRIAGKHRPVADGTVSKTTARFTSISLLLIAIGLELGFGNRQSQFLVVFIAAGVMCYSPVAWFWPAMKNLYTALLCTTPLVYAGILTGVSPSPSQLALFVLFFLGRELLLDVRDLAGDERAGQRTTAVVLGRHKAAMASFTIMSTATLAFVLVVTGTMSTVFASISLASVGIVAFLWYRGSEQLAIVASRVTMVCGVVAVSISGIV